MRQPLRYQIMIPMLALTLAALVAVSLLNAYLAVDRARKQIESQLAEITRTLDQSSFPLTRPILLQMRGLSGAEFVAALPAGTIAASSLDLNKVGGLPLEFANHSDVTLRRRISIGGVNYFHMAKPLRRQNVDPQATMLHILYPEAGYREVWKDAVMPPLAIGLAAGLLAVLSAVAIASRVSRPIMQLQSQVARIARGNFSPMVLPERQDEIRDLMLAINQMANMLAQYEGDVRQTERLSTLAQLGGGLAHQMRNAATGCRMAVDILAEEHSVSLRSECLIVARRQLELMETHLQRLLTMGQPSKASTLKPINWGDFVEEVLPLLRPAARHAGVELFWHEPTEPIEILADRGELEQLIINLILNAIEAAALPGKNLSVAPAVRLQLSRKDLDFAEFVVQDSGPGPPSSIQDTLFDPFVTSKLNGIGLGLSVVRRVVEQHAGRITWDRDSGWTCFRVILPQWKPENCSVEPARGG